MSEFTFQLNESSNLTKVQQLIHAVTQAVATGQLKEGDFLPSVNKLNKDSGVSRDTIFKAYTKLKQQNIVASTPTKGYYIAAEKFKVFVLLDDFSSFKEQLYKNLRKNLPDRYSVDLMFHHYNEEVFESLIMTNIGRYSMYLVMNLNDGPLHPAIKKIDSDKLLVMDMGKPKLEEVSYINQEFDKAAYDCLVEGEQLLKKYDNFYLVYPQSQTPHPKDVMKAFNRFCKNYDMKGSVINSVDDHEVKKGDAYWVIKDSHLVNIVKACHEKELELGVDVGVLAYNDTPMKEVIDKGITTMSIDFVRMGQMAAQYILQKQQVQTTLPTMLTVRGSL
ncbi:GntR family transcriptional regulator [Prolixibacteraceae bacterium JC049]|nr:GntR family transcriptional regulator [Prolixibacteraceae bacterium JC049]